MDKLLTTGDAARILNRSVDRIRSYEREGKLPAQRTKSGYRLFRARDVERLSLELQRKGDERHR